MYCPSCGLESTPGLNYCKRCGATLNLLALADARPVSVAKPTWALGTTVSVVTIGGFGALFAFLMEILSPGRPVHIEALIPLSALVIISVLIVDILLIRLLSRLINYHLGGAQPLPLKPASVNALPASHEVPQLAEPRSSVTDSTTRLFEQPLKEPVGSKITSPHASKPVHPGN